MFISEEFRLREKSQNYTHSFLTHSFYRFIDSFYRFPWLVIFCHICFIMVYLPIILLTRTYCFSELFTPEYLSVYFLEIIFSYNQNTPKMYQKTIQIRILTLIQNYYTIYRASSNFTDCLINVFL